MRVAFMDPLEARLVDFPAEYMPSPDFEVLTTDTPGVLPDGWQTADAAVWWDTPRGREHIDAMPNLQFLQRIRWFRSNGDATAALERGSPVAVTPFGYRTGWHSTASR